MTTYLKIETERILEADDIKCLMQMDGYCYKNLEVKELENYDLQHHLTDEELLTAMQQYHRDQLKLKENIGDFMVNHYIKNQSKLL